MSEPAATVPEPAPPKPSAWAAAFFLSYLALQILLPLHQLFVVGDGRFGWRMYAGTRERPSPPTVDVRPVSGDWRRLADSELRRYLLRPGSLRSGAALLPAHLCRVLPAAAEIRLIWTRNKTQLVFPCPPRDADRSATGSTRS